MQQNKKILDNKGQASAEIILLIGGILAIVLLVSNYVTNMTITTQENFKKVLMKERTFILNKI